MSISVRFHREDPWELIRLMRAVMPNTLLNFITTGMRFISWQPCDEDVMRLAFRCVVRNGIRRFQFAEPANDPQALRRVAADGPRGGRRGDRRRPHLLDQPGAHACLLRRARRGARRLPRHRPLLPEGPGRPAHARRGAGARAELRRDRAHDRAPQPLHDRARAVRLHGGRAAGLRRPPHGDRPGRQRDVAADRRVDRAEPRGRGIRAQARSRGSRPGRRVLPTSSFARSACPPACRSSTTPPTIAISSRAGWSRRRDGCSRRSAAPSSSTPCSRRSCGCGPRWATRSSSRRSPSSSPTRRRGT